MTTTDDTGRDWLELVLAGEWDNPDPEPAQLLAPADRAAAPAAPEAPALTADEGRERKRAERQARRQAEWDARNQPNPVAEEWRARQREAAEARKRAAAAAAKAEAEKQAAAEADEEAVDGDGDGESDVEVDESEVRRPWWSLKPAPAAEAGTAGPGSEAGADGTAAAVPAAAPAPVMGPPPSVVRKFAASRWGWLAYHGSAAAVGHGALWGLTGNRMGGAAWLEAAMVGVIPVTTAAVACCAGWAGWKLGRALGPYVPVVGGLAAPAGLIGGLAWGQGTTSLVAEVFAWAAPWPVLAAPAVIAALAGTGCWALLDRRARARDWAPPLRWAAHIPLATVALSAALYAPGALL